MFEIDIAPENLTGDIKSIIQAFLDLYTVLGTDNISGVASLSERGFLTIELTSLPTDEFNWAVADTFAQTRLPKRVLYCTKLWKSLSDFRSLKELESYLEPVKTL